MKQIIRILYICLFFLICAVPMVALCLADNAEYKFESPGQTDDYVMEHFPFREEYIAINSQLQANLFSTAAVDEVVVGQDGMLFFTETVDDFTGVDPLSEDTIHAIATTLSLVEEYVENQGCHFTLAVAPNKNSIYPEYMPKNYVQLDTPSNWERLEAHLDCHAVDLFTPLRQSDEMLYLYSDSHWNNEGAFLAFQEILKELGASDHLPQVETITKKQDFNGDLTAMLLPDQEVPELQTYYQFDHTFEFLSRFRGVDDLHIETQCEEAKDSVVVFRDSFGNALLEDFATAFAHVQYSRVVPYQVDLAQDADYMVLEIVERNLENLVASAPKMLAPKRDLPEDSHEITPTALEWNNKKDYCHVFGYFPGEMPDTLYLTADTGTFEAFPILEKSLEAPEGAIGFSAYLPLDTAPDTVTLWTKG